VAGFQAVLVRLGARPGVVVSVPAASRAEAFRFAAELLQHAKGRGWCHGEVCSVKIEADPDKP
jgi:hypothetical protein